MREQKFFSSVNASGDLSNNSAPDLDSTPDSSEASSIEEIVLRDYVHAVEIHSLDGDGCFLPCFSMDSAYQKMVQHNLSFSMALIERLRKHPTPHTIFLVGSARQNWLQDVMGMFQLMNGRSCITESYFYALAEFVDDINLCLKSDLVRLDKFLLDDVSLAREPGESFNKATSCYGGLWCCDIKSMLSPARKKFEPVEASAVSKTIEDIKRMYFEDNPITQPFFCENQNKFCLLYTQMHHIACQFLDDAAGLHFHFYDDRLDILWRLLAVFTHGSHLIPESMTLHLHHYVRGVQQTNSIDYRPIVQSVEGTGLIDHCYQDTLKSIVALLGTSVGEDNTRQFPVCIGNPIDLFFKIEGIGEFTVDLILPSTVTVTTTDVFDRFDAERLERLQETPSFREVFDRLEKAIAPFPAS